MPRSPADRHAGIPLSTPKDPTKSEPTKRRVGPWSRPAEPTEQGVGPGGSRPGMGGMLVLVGFSAAIVQ
ncbi:hypothetical protein Aple_077940 [Acrocarpospora pleiomorpha]|uniref:Uncharacterized protein n=1 Tax=Acrocarpospora pleiomorpha TaxID=90975 RepID=A0A5M3XUI6_9ACTN|nr:hypothetical protein Aple_077940 [Acrocarpospora pleiomorpha]